MLTLGQKELLYTFGLILGDTECEIDCEQVDSGVRIRVYDRDSYVNLEGIGRDVGEAVDSVIREFEEHPMGTKLESVKEWISAGCPEDSVMVDASPDDFGSELDDFEEERPRKRQRKDRRKIRAMFRED